MLNDHGRPIRAIETCYKGYRFRSRLEARWAVFMDTIRVEYRYEPEGFELGTCRYLPDFLLPDLDLWLEIKPALTADDLAVEKASRLAAITGRSVVMLCGDPWPGEYEGLIWFGGNEEQSGGFDTHYRWCQCYGCFVVGLQYDGAANRNCECVPDNKKGDAGHDLVWPDSECVEVNRNWRRSSQTRDLVDAYRSARSYRFEEITGLRR